MKNLTPCNKVSFILNILIVILTIIGIVVMFAINVPIGGLISYGFENFKYYTVLSNVASGVVAAVYLFRKDKDGISGRLISAKLMSVSAVTLTFLIIALFLGPIYGHAMMYRGSNVFFHLIVPILAMIEFVILDTGNKIPFRYAVYSMIPTIIYGVCYALNLFLNGIGQWPETNDWYGFVNWGYPVGFAIFGMIILATFATACLLRFAKNKLTISN